MTLTSIGDLARHFQSIQQNRLLRSEMDRRTQELSTGEVTDIAQSLGGDTTKLAAVDRSLSLNQSYARAASDTASFLDVKQLGLERIDSLRGDLADQLLLVEPTGATPPIDAMSNIAQSSFSDLVSALNSSHGGRALFAGTASDGAALAGQTTILNALVNDVSGATDAASLLAAVDDWFDAPGGGFETSAYVGGPDAGNTRRIAAGREVDLGDSAASRSMRQVLKMTAIGAIANRSDLSLTERDRATLIRTAGEGLLSAAEGVATTRSALGAQQAKVELAQSQGAAEASVLSQIRNDYVGADPFETATALKEIQTQLETHYTLVARLSRLSLAEYLR